MSNRISKLLCLGDSLTQAYGISESKCWVTLLSNSTNYSCINAGTDVFSCIDWSGRGPNSERNAAIIQPERYK